MVTTRSKRLGTSEEIASQPTLVSTLPVLVDSGFVGAAELGLLCQTSKELFRATHSDQLWASLCLKLWPCTEFLPQDFVALHGGHRWLYKQWVCGTIKRFPNRNPMPPPAYTAPEIQLFVNVEYKGKPFLSDDLGRTGLDILLEHGAVSSTLKGPIILCEAEWEYLESYKNGYLMGKLQDGLFTWGKALDVSDFQARMHVRTGTSMCCVFAQQCEACRDCVKIHPVIKEGEELSENSEFDLSKPQNPCVVRFNPFDWGFDRREELALKHTPAAAEIKSRLPDRIGFEFELILGIVEGGYYAVTGYQIRFVKVDKDGNCEEFECSTEEEAHGVTLLHILSELQGTDFRLERFKP